MRSRRRYGKAALCIIEIICLLVVSVMTSLAEDSVSASVMRLSTVEGTVTVEEAGGKTMPVLKNMRLHSGYTLETGQNSYAGLMLDDTKAAKLDALSRAGVKKTGKKLELLVESGSLLCDVKKPLDGDETLNIRTSTTITGIRGTVLYVKVIDENTSMIYVLEGEVHVLAMDPDTGKTANAVVRTGQRALAVTGAKASQGLFADVLIEGFEKEEIDGYVLIQVAEDSSLAERLRAAGWDVDWMIANANRRLEEDQAAAADRLERLQNAKTESGRTVIDQMHGDAVSDSSSGSAQNSGVGTVVLDWPVSVAEVAEKLRTNNVRIRQNSIESGWLEIDQDLTVPAGRRLEISEGINLVVQSGKTLQVDGTLELSGNVVNNGTIRNTSWNTLNIGGSYESQGGTIKNTGRMIVGTKLTIKTSSSFDNQGGEIHVKGSAEILGSTLNFGSSTVTIDGDMMLKDVTSSILNDGLTVGGSLILRGSKYVISGGTYENGVKIPSCLDLTVEGGTVRSGQSDYAIAMQNENGFSITNKIVLRSGGLVCAGSAADAAVDVDNGTLELDEGVLWVEDENVELVEGENDGKVMIKNPSSSGPDKTVSVSDFQNLSKTSGEYGWQLDFSQVTFDLTTLLSFIPEMDSVLLSTPSEAAGMKEEALEEEETLEAEETEAEEILDDDLNTKPEEETVEDLEHEEKEESGEGTDNKEQETEPEEELEDILEDQELEAEEDEVEEQETDPQEGTAEGTENDSKEAVEG